ncbi:MAG TPA: amino acid ABC transporter permease [Stellaceae bacterium]|nr:amino acid ABC transporter permease [Stellaceae bacterium]
MATRASRVSGRRVIFDMAQLALALAAIVWVVLNGAGAFGYNWQWYRVPPYIARVADGQIIWGPLVRGLLVTLEISAWGLILTLAIGLVTALLRTSRSFAGRVLAGGYVQIIRNTPLLVQLYLFYFVLAPILGIGRFWTGILCLGFFEGSFAAEIFRAGIQSIPKGQWEASGSLGLGRYVTLRSVILPQAFQLMLPPLTGQAVSLIKDSSIVSVIAVFDLTNEGRTIISDTFMSFEIWFTVAAIYLVLTISLSAVAGHLERRVASYRFT